MKKILTISMGLAALTAMGAPSNVPTNKFPTEALSSISANGEWAVGNTDAEFSIVIRNLYTGKSWLYEWEEAQGGPQYAPAIGNAASDAGVVVGEVGDRPAYWVNGEWNFLPVGDYKNMTQMGGISADGSVIFGAIGKQGMSDELDDVQFTRPCVWYRNADGTYGDPLFLPQPERDLTNAIPQYFTPIAISSDCNTIGALMTCNYGNPHVPYVFTRDASGQWSYNMIGADLINPDNLVFPEFHGSYNGPARPNYEDYLTEAQQEAYLAEAKIYGEELQASGDYTDEEIELILWGYAAKFMSEPQEAEFTKLWNEYLKAYNDWALDFLEYESVLARMLTDGMNFEMNNLCLSSDGKYLYATGTEYVHARPGDPENAFDVVLQPVRFDTATGESFVFSSNNAVYLSSVADDGSVLGRTVTGDDYIYTEAYIFPQGAYESVSLDVYMKDNGHDGAAIWMENNLFHEVMAPNASGTGFIIVDSYSMGIPRVTPDMSLIMFTTSTANWSPEENYLWISYVLNVDQQDTGVEEIASGSDAAMRLLPGGVVELDGQFASLEIYDLSGATVYSVAAPAARTATGLGTGVYVVRALSADGDVIVRKAVF